MSFQPIGDLAQSFLLQRHNTALKRTMDRLTGELSSGQASDLTRHLDGGLARLADIDHKLVTLERYRSAAAEAQADTGLMQTALEAVQTHAGTLSGAALTHANGSGTADIASLSIAARAGLEGIVSALNSSAAGRALFAGNDPAGAPLRPAAELLSAATAAVSGATGAPDVEARLDAFFDDPGGGFETLIYQGGDDGPPPYRLGPGDTLALDLQADDPALRAVLKQTVLAAVLDDPSLALSESERAALAKRAGEGLLARQTDLAHLRAGLGLAEGRIEEAGARLAAESAALELAKGQMVSVDPYETASELETVQLRLETLYNPDSG